MVYAVKHFEWALANNPKCTTCLKDWVEIIMIQKVYTGERENTQGVIITIIRKPRFRCIIFIRYNIIQSGERRKKY